ERGGALDVALFRVEAKSFHCDGPSRWLMEACMESPRRIFWERPLDAPREGVPSALQVGARVDSVQQFEFCIHLAEWASRQDEREGAGPALDESLQRARFMVSFELCRAFDRNFGPVAIRYMCELIVANFDAPKWLRRGRSGPLEIEPFDSI